MRSIHRCQRRIGNTRCKMCLLITWILLPLYLMRIDAVLIPFISNVYFKPLNDNSSDTSILLNRTCQQCLCEFFTSGWNTSYVALNCYPNQTCQFYSVFAITYKLQSTPGASLHFLKNQLPNVTSCCMPNITQLINQLKSATPTSINLGLELSAIGYDPLMPNETVVIGRNGAWMYRFGLSPFAWIRNSSIVNSSLSIALHNNQVFTASDGVPSIKVYDNQTGHFLFSIDHSMLTKVRKMIFINNGQNMVVTAQGSQSLLIFDIQSSTNYTVQQILPFPAPNVHGLARWDDTLLYAGSWDNRAIYSYQYQNSSWIIRSFVNVSSGSTGSHLAVDDCGRVWFIITNFGLRIFDPSGVEIGNWNLSSTSSILYDFLLLPNYVLLLSMRQAHQLIRYDPQVSCT